VTDEKLQSISRSTYLEPLNVSFLNQAFQNRGCVRAAARCDIWCWAAKKM